MLSGPARWFLYIMVCSIVLYLMWLRLRRNPINLPAAFGVCSLVALPFMSGSLLNRWLGEGHEGQGFVDLSISSPMLSVLIAIPILIVVSWMWQTETLSLPFLASLLVSMMALMNTRIGDTIVTLGRGSLPFLLALFVITLVVAKSFFQVNKVSVTKSVSVYAGLVYIVAVGLALRVDGFRTEGSWYHVSYFIGVIQTVRSGGLLLWDTPSQYGFLNVILPASMPILNPEQAFISFQALLLAGVSIAVFAHIRSLTNAYAGLVFGSVFIVLINFSDPLLIGPQPFPSSSVMRFGPSLVLLVTLDRWNHRREVGLRSDAILTFTIAVAVLWSFESAFYSCAIVGVWMFGELLESRGRGQSLRRKMRAVILGAMITIFLAFVYSAYVVIRVGSLPMWQWFWLAASKYAAGHGQLPTDLWGAIWLIISAIVACLALLCIANEEGRASSYASVGALLGWCTYYLGRSHSSNVIVMLPLLFTAVLIPTLRVLHQTNKDEDTIRQIFRSSLDVPFGVTVALSAIIGAGVITSPELPGVVARARPFPMTAIYEPAVSFPNALEELLNSIDIKELPVAYQGYFGMLPKPPDSIARRLDYEATWLPLPLALLEEPIPAEIRDQMVNRRFQRQPQDGYLIWHKSLSHQGRAEDWLKVVSETHKCALVGDNSDWQIQECRVRSK